MKHQKNAAPDSKSEPSSKPGARSLGARPRSQSAAMDPLDYWRLCDELSVVQAALLTVGEDPSAHQDQIDEQFAGTRPPGFDAAKAALINAIMGKRLVANVVHWGDIDGESDSHGPDWHGTTIMVEDLRTWLRSRGIKTGFFFPAEVGPDYLSEVHPNYSAKLAAAIEARKAIFC